MRCRLVSGEFVDEDVSVSGYECNEYFYRLLVGVGDADEIGDGYACVEV
jgi:hypothetical protein